jgi:hypothetical protein
MTRVSLVVHPDPGHAETFLRFRQKNGTRVHVKAVIDTGSHATLLPATWEHELDIRNPRRVTLERAGVPGLEFEATEATIMVRVEDKEGNSTAPFEITIWFAGTIETLTGFDGLLNRAILHLDMPNLSGYLEFPD